MSTLPFPITVDGTNGYDGGRGLIAPVKTIRRAFEVIRPCQEIHIKAGIYTESLTDKHFEWCKKNGWPKSAKSRIKIIGEPGVIWNFTEAARMLWMWSGQHISFHNIVFDASGSSLGKTVSLTHPANNIRFYDCGFKGFKKSEGSVVGTLAPDCCFIRCKFYDSGEHGIYVATNTQHGDRASHRLVLFDCEFWNNKKWGIHINNEDWPLDPKGIVIAHNYSHGNYGGLVSSGGVGTRIYRNTITNNERGVWLGYKGSEGTRLERNAIIFNRREGLMFDECVKNAQIRKNVIAFNGKADVFNRTGTNFGTGTVWDDNFVRDGSNKGTTNE